MVLRYMALIRCGRYPKLTSLGSCNGRGPRAAGWFHDYIQVKKDVTMNSCILEGGIKGWIASGNDYIGHIEGYDAGKWN
jgi:arsenical-resistance protein 2